MSLKTYFVNTYDYTTSLSDRLVSCTTQESTVCRRTEERRALSLITLPASRCDDHNKRQSYSSSSAFILGTAKGSRALAGALARATLTHSQTNTVPQWFGQSFVSITFIEWMPIVNSISLLLCIPCRE